MILQSVAVLPPTAAPQGSLPLMEPHAQGPASQPLKGPEPGRVWTVASGGSQGMAVWVPFAVVSTLLLLLLLFIVLAVVVVIAVSCSRSGACSRDVNVTSLEGGPSFEAQHYGFGV
ncbi:unnamed protein product [Lampetra fluviatilis]